MNTTYSPLTSQFLANLTDEELIRAVDQYHDPRTTSPAEIELLRRLSASVEFHDDMEALQDAADNFGFEPEDITRLGDAMITDSKTTAALLDALSRANIDDVDDLEADLRIAKDFLELAADAEGAFERLARLSATAVK